MFDILTLPSSGTVATHGSQIISGLTLVAGLMRVPSFSSVTYSDYDSLVSGARTRREKSVYHAHLDGKLLCSSLPSLYGLPNLAKAGPYNPVLFFGRLYTEKGMGPAITSPRRISFVHSGVAWSASVSGLEYFVFCRNRSLSVSMVEYAVQLGVLTSRSVNSVFGSAISEEDARSVLREKIATKTWSAVSFSTRATLSAVAISPLQTVRLSLHDLPLVPDNRSEVYWKAAEKSRAYLGNNYEIVPGFTGLSSQIASTGEAIRKLLTSQGVKALAGQYLSYLYGYSQLAPEVTNTFKNAQALATPPTFRREVVRAGRSEDASNALWTGSFDTYAKIVYDPIDNPFANYYRLTYDSGWAPTPGYLWEAVPFSFVLDWFTNIGNALDRLDTSNYMATLRIIDTVVSQKIVVSRESWARGLTGTLVYTKYSRVAGYRPEPWSTSFFRGDIPSSLGRHALEAAALLVVNN